MSFTRLSTFVCFCDCYLQYFTLTLHCACYAKLLAGAFTVNTVSPHRPGRLLAICKLTAAKTQRFLFNETPGGPAVVQLALELVQKIAADFFFTLFLFGLCIYETSV